MVGKLCRRNVETMNVQGRICAGQVDKPSTAVISLTRISHLLLLVGLVRFMPPIKETSSSGRDTTPLAYQLP